MILSGLLMIVGIVRSGFAAMIAAAIKESSTTAPQTITITGGKRS